MFDNFVKGFGNILHDIDNLVNDRHGFDSITLKFINR